MSEAGLAAAQQKMADAGVAREAIEVFSHYYRLLEEGATGIIAEDSITPLENPPMLADIDVSDEDARQALGRTVIIKLNGGLGTSMGLDAAKTLLEVRDGKSFLDIIADQVLAARREYGVRLPLVLMNSFRTRDDCLAALAKHPDLQVEGIPLDFLQNQEPKLRADDLTPVVWDADPGLEWCPAGPRRPVHRAGGLGHSSHVARAWFPLCLRVERRQPGRRSRRHHCWLVRRHRCPLRRRGVPPHGQRQEGWTPRRACP